MKNRYYFLKRLYKDYVIVFKKKNYYLYGKDKFIRYFKKKYYYKYIRKSTY